MRTRTLLTTPPSQTPTEDVPAVRERPERYSRGLALPTEPKVPGRYRAVRIALVTAAVIALIAWLVLRVLLAGQFQDPALNEVPAGESTFEDGEQDPTLQLPDEATTPAG